MEGNNNESVEKLTILGDLGVNDISKYDDVFLNTFDQPVVETLRDCNQEILELQESMDIFEATYPIEELMAIGEFTDREREVEEHRVRAPALGAVKNILSRLQILEKETNISPERRKELRDRYKILNKAVGIIRGNIVDHG